MQENYKTVEIVLYTLGKGIIIGYGNVNIADPGYKSKIKNCIMRHIDTIHDHIDIREVNVDTVMLMQINASPVECTI